jgi:cell division protein FtsQ
MAGVAWVLLGSGWLVVRSVRVTGTGRLVTRAHVLAAARVPMGLPLVRLNAGAVAQRVERIPQVESAAVSTNWPSTVVISVRLRTPVFAVAGPRGYALIDRFGVTVRTAPARPLGLPLLTLRPPVRGGLRGSGAVRAAATVLGELPRPLAGRVRTVSVAGPAAVSVQLADGVVIVWGDTARAKQKARELTAVMHRRARLYDVSGTGTVMTKG